MAKYVEGFVLPVAKRKLKEYRKMASQGGKMWKKYGALEYFECIGDDLTSAKKWGCLTFPKMAKAKPGETVFFSFIVYKSKSDRNRINAKVMKGVKKNEHPPMPFDMKRMAVGGFSAVVEY